MKRRNILASVAVIFLSVLALAAYLMYSSAKSDSTPPTIKIDDGMLTLSVSDGRDRLFEGVTAADETDGNVTDSVIVESVYGITEDGYVTVRYAAFDKAGNVASAERTVRYSDYKSPTVTLSHPLAFEYGSIFNVFDYVSAHDVFDGDITRKIKATMLSEGISIAAEGTHEVQFRVTNSVGDTVQLVLPVEIYPDDTYNAELTLSDWIVYVPAGGEFDASSYLSKFVTLYEEVSLEEGVPEDIAIRVTGEPDLTKAGVYPVSYTASRNVNGKEYVAYTRLIVIVEGGESNG